MIGSVSGESTGTTFITHTFKSFNAAANLIAQWRTFIGSYEARDKEKRKEEVKLDSQIVKQKRTIVMSISVSVKIMTITN